MKDKVLEILKNSEQAMRPGDIAKKNGLDKLEVDKAIKVLKKEGSIYSPKRCFYDISK